MAVCTEKRAKALAGQARFRARALARRIYGAARRDTPSVSGNLRRAWRRKRWVNGIWIVHNSAAYAVFVEARTMMLLKAAERYLPAVHVDAVYDPVSVSLSLDPWGWERIMYVECRMVKGDFVKLPPPKDRGSDPVS